MTMDRIILASQSATRVALLKAAAIAFEPVPAAVDERLVEAPLIATGRTPADIAMALAAAKAMDVGAAERNAWVIGADQTLDADGERWNKPATMDDARKQLRALSGRTHALNTAVAVAHAGAVRWRHVETVRLTMRPLSATDIEAYLGLAGDSALSSVGAYQIEGPGIQLFDRIDGDYFAILGLPLLPLLKWLRGEGALG
jgi:septum formation protein